MTKHLHHHQRHLSRRSLQGDRVSLAMLWLARLLVTVLVGAGLIDGMRTAAFLFHSTGARGHVVSRSEVTSYQPLELGKYGGLQFVRVSSRQVEVEFVDRAGVSGSQYVPESACRKVDESNIPIRLNFNESPCIRVDTFFGLWGATTLALLAGVLLGAFTELFLR